MSAWVISPESISIPFKVSNCLVYIHVWYRENIIWQFSYHTPYQPEGWYVSRVDMGYCMKIAISLSIYRTFFFLTSLPFWYRMRSQRQDDWVLRIWWYGFFTWAKKLYHPRDPVIWVFCPGKKKRITHVTHYHTFCAPQEWYVLGSHVSITYAKWTYFLVNVW